MSRHWDLIISVQVQGYQVSMRLVTFEVIYPSATLGVAGAIASDVPPLE